MTQLKLEDEQVDEWSPINDLSRQMEACSLGTVNDVIAYDEFVYRDVEYVHELEEEQVDPWVECAAVARS